MADDHRSNKRFCRSPADFEEAAADWMRAWGFRDALRSRTGKDGGIDVESSKAVAQVKAWMIPVGSPEIQQLKGAAHDGRIAIFFSLMHYTPAAIEFAEKADVALFRFSGYDGVVEPANICARRLAAGVAEAPDHSALAEQLLAALEEVTRTYGAVNVSVGGEFVVAFCASPARSAGVARNPLTRKKVWVAASEGAIDAHTPIAHDPRVRRTVHELGWRPDHEGFPAQSWQLGVDLHEVIQCVIDLLILAHGVLPNDELEMEFIPVD